MRVSLGEEAVKWGRLNDQLFEHLLEKNISPDGLPPGVVIASPSRGNRATNEPNYYFVWTRDSARVMMHLTHEMAVARQGRSPRTQARYQDLLRHMKGFVDFTLKIQSVENRSGHVGEPKFHVDGTAFNEEWGRPQNDGPALRASTLIKFADELRKAGGEDYVRKHMYNGDQHSQSAIKRDLEFVANHWREPSFDLWEEVKGMHRYTLRVQQKALEDGARFADEMGDHGAADFYRRQAAEIAQEVKKFWNPETGVIEATRDRVAGITEKASNTDVATLMAELHAEGDVTDPEVLATAAQLEDAFSSLYKINHDHPELGTAIGRYPEDTWNGVDRGDRGNPWIITTAAFAELYAKAATRFQSVGEITVDPINGKFFAVACEGLGIDVVPGRVLRKGTEDFDRVITALKARGRLFLARIEAHAGTDGALPEQFDGATGAVRGARHLTWSYEATLAAVRAQDGP